MPGGSLVTAPLPDPVREIVKRCGFGVNVAVTVTSVIRVSRHVAVPKQAPDHPANDEAALAVAVSVTTAPPA